MILAISDSGSCCRRSAAVAPLVGSIRISNGASKRKLNPRSGESNCNEETPSVDQNAVWILLTASCRTALTFAKVSLKGSESFAEGASRSLCKPAPMGSRSIPTTRVFSEDFRIASLCPAKTTVQSMKRPSLAQEAKRQCSLQAARAMGPRPMPPKGAQSPPPVISIQRSCVFCSPRFVLAFRFTKYKVPSTTAKYQVSRIGRPRPSVYGSAEHATP
jgi:hypothetical protein